ncbi:MAG: isoprenylcysteine carboxylmethyltransferase family protein [Candidatus Marinimicrobia bacterium]|nr:isoprenylcysteine carboxylmethyltransferase family protein [Candidatus Neomarinimicrobiota bacterium]
MNKHTIKILTWLPRILCIIFALFISVFALDVFSEGYSLLKAIIALGIHLIPTFLIIFTLLISWKREWIGAIIYIILGIAYIFMAWGKFPISVYLLLAGPLFLIGLLFGLRWVFREDDKMNKEAKPKKNHHDRDDLTGEHKLGDAGQATIAILFVIVWLADSFFFKNTTFLNDVVPNIIRVPIGIILLIVSGYLAVTTLSIVFGEIREVPGVIRKGVYNVCRHPMYLSEILLYLGLLIISMSVAAAVVWILTIGFLYYLCRHEEKLLLERFGDEYRNYMQEVPMWIPRVWRKLKK